MTGIDRLNPKSTAAMTVLAGLLEARTGQRIAANRLWRIETALKPMLRALGLDSLDALVGVLVLGERGGELADKVVDALLNQETSFYRDATVFSSIEAAIDLVAQNGGTRRPRIWSAACSTGQEPLSLAMLFAERAARTGAIEPEIVATDVSEAALNRARAGRYTQFEIQRGLPVRRMIEWFDTDDKEWVAKPDLVRRVSYRRHNLVNDAPPAGRFDIVLCRNALLYFSADLRRRVLARIASALRPDGLLVLGAGETVMGQGALFVASSRFKPFYEPSADTSAAMGVA